MRLIDADKYPCKGCGSMDDWCKHTCGMLKEWLYTTAYDVDKVVEKIEQYACAECKEAGTYKRFYYGMGCKACAYGKILSIIKRGGIDD